MKFLKSFEGPIYSLARIVVGFLFLQHGAQKLFGVLGGAGGSGEPAALFSLMGLAGVIEFFAGLLIMLGWFTVYAAFVASGLMAVAYFTAHAPQGFWPILNGGELAAFYAWIFLFFAAKGPGTWSLDRLFGRR
jgi:putative oxidoreductase